MITEEYRAEVRFTHDEYREADVEAIQKCLLVSSIRSGKSFYEPDADGKEDVEFYAYFSTREGAEECERYLEEKLAEARACLEDCPPETKAEYSCPVCGSTVLEVYVQQAVVVDFDPYNAPDGESHEVLDGPRGDVEWDDTCTAQCGACGHITHLGDMHKP